LLKVELHVGMDGIAVADSFKGGIIEFSNSATVTVAKALRELMLAGG
jgi:hypothetical protein